MNDATNPIAVAAFARSPMKGKRSSDVKARVTDEVKFELQRRCAELGITESDYIDRLLCVSLFGPEEVLRSEEEKTTKIMGWWHKVTTKK